MRISQPTLSRALRTLGQDLVTIGAARSIQYLIQDPARQALRAPVYRVSPEGQVSEIGTLLPVCPEGFVMQQIDGQRVHTPGLPWWLFDTRPQGYLGRAFNQRYGAQLGLPARLDDWNDSHVLRALMLQGSDLPGNLLVGQAARDLFVNAAAPQPVPEQGKPQAYAELAAAAARGELAGSSAGGEQPKFTAYVETSAAGPAHVIVKFSAQADSPDSPDSAVSPVPQRWRDLLAAEHLALEVLHAHGLPASRSALYEHQGQRFLEVCRFDRIGPSGRRALFSLAALDAEFVGSGLAWPQVCQALARAGVITREAVELSEVLWAFGTLIGNTDMHGGNLSFMSEPGRPCEMAPTYDMTCMAFAPTAGGNLAFRPLSLHISSAVPAGAWHQALDAAQDFVARLQGSEALSGAFGPCVEALVAHVAESGERIGRLMA